MAAKSFREDIRRARLEALNAVKPIKKKPEVKVEAKPAAVVAEKPKTK